MFRDETKMNQLKQTPLNLTQVTNTYIHLELAYFILQTQKT